MSSRGKFSVRRLVLSLGFVVVVVGAYLFGALSHSRNYFPMSQLRSAADRVKGRYVKPGMRGTYDEFGRLAAFPGKHQVECPPPGKSVAVLLTMGQSNSANHGEKLYETRHKGRVFNYFGGACYDASSPLLGATGERGEFLTYLADLLVDSGKFSTVILVPSSIGGTPVSRWQRDGDLNDMVLNVINEVQEHYRVTHILFHQGEADFRNSTSAKVYAASFNSMKDSLREIGVDAPFFVSISTKCGRDARWLPENPTALGQQMVVQGDSRVFLGANTDSLLASGDRTDDECHLSESGQVKTAESFARAIEEFHEQESRVGEDTSFTPASPQADVAGHVSPGNAKATYTPPPDPPRSLPPLAKTETN